MCITYLLIYLASLFLVRTIKLVWFAFLNMKLGKKAPILITKTMMESMKE